MILEINMNFSEITPTELKQRLDDGENVQIIDVREQREYDFASIPNTKLIPLAQVPQRQDEIDQSREAVIMCRSGGRSAQAIQFLQRMGYQGKLTNLKGGILAWSDEVDPTVPKY